MMQSIQSVVSQITGLGKYDKAVLLAVCDTGSIDPAVLEDQPGLQGRETIPDNLAFLRRVGFIDSGLNEVEIRRYAETKQFKQTGFFDLTGLLSGEDPNPIWLEPIESSLVGHFIDKATSEHGRCRDKYVDANFTWTASDPTTHKRPFTCAREKLASISAPLIDAYEPIAKLLDEQDILIHGQVRKPVSWMDRANASKTLFHEILSRRGDYDLGDLWEIETALIRDLREFEDSYEYAAQLLRRQKKSQQQSSKQSSPAPAAPEPTNAGAVEVTLVTQSFADIEAKPVIWLWKDRIPKGKLAIFSGNPDCGKTTVLIDIVARYTTGRDWSDGATNAVEPGEVLMLIAEDDSADTIKPRLIAAEADISRVSYLKAVRIKRNAKIHERAIALDQDLALLEDTLKKNPRIGLVTIDPLTSYIGRSDINKEQDIRRVLDPIKEMCERTAVTLIGAGHFNKRSDVGALQKVGGSVAMGGAPRAVWLFAKDPKEKGLYLMMLGKGNLTKKRTGMKFRFGEKELLDGIRAPFIAWEGEEETTADEVLDLERNPQERKREKAERFLGKHLVDGAKPSEPLIEAAGREGIGRNAMFAAKKALGIRHEKRNGCYWWSLREGDGEGNNPF